MKFHRSITFMAPKFVRKTLLLEVLLITAVIGTLGGGSAPVSGMTRSSPQSDTQQQTRPRGIRGALIHRDRFSSPADAFQTRPEKLEDDARRSLRRVRSLRRRGRALLDTTVDWESPVSDASSAEYLMEISLGTPAQNFVAVADTGSDLTWLQCMPCDNCFQQSAAHFDPTLSSTYAQLTCASPICEFLNETGANCPYTTTASAAGCEYAYGYQDGSQTMGTLSADTINIMDMSGGTDSVPNFSFGCSHTATSSSSLLTNADGLVGLGRGLASIPSQLGNQFGNIFSYCLVNRSASVVEDSPLIFGDAAVPDGFQLQYITMVTNSVAGHGTFYYVNLEGITVNGIAVPNIPAEAFAINSVDGSGGTFFDSGTTYTSVVSEIYDPLVTAVSNVIVNFQPTNVDSSDFTLCYAASWESWISEYGNGVPALSFQFDNSASFDLLVDGSWLQYSDEVVCLAILKSSGINIFGNVQQAGFLVVYDLENSQIGFNPSNCY